MINIKCEQCGSRDAIAKGLCRICYDKGRTDVFISISKRIQEDFDSFVEQKRWSKPKAINYLIECGLKWIKEREKVIKEWELDK